MAFLNIVQMAQPADGVPIAQMPPMVMENVTVSGTSAQSTAFVASAVTVRLEADAACWINFGTDPTAAAGDIYFSGGAEYFRVRPGDKVAAVAA